MPLATSLAPPAWYLVACAAGTVVLLILLIARLRLHPALALATAAFALGIAARMPWVRIPVSFSAGVGNLMGHIAVVLGLGAILGNLLARSGGATALGRALVDSCGPRGLPWALLGLGMLVGMPVFFEVGLVLLMPIVAAAAHRSQRPPILVGIPLMAGLSIVHGTLPPHPAAMLATAQYHADLGRTILWGLAVAIPAGIMAGPVLGWLLNRLLAPAMMRKATTSEPGLALFEEAGIEMEEAAVAANAAPMPAGPLRAASAILLPIALIFVGSWADALSTPGTAANQMLHFILSMERSSQRQGSSAREKTGADG